ncbi:imidazole glycerol phosphate synthase subunit HisH [Alphaproteobacteria bacterium LSUCC0684]
MRVAVVDYGSGNLQSVMQAIRASARDAGLSHEAILTSNAGDVAGADYVVLPGVGAYADCAAGIRGLPEMAETLNRRVIEDGRPFLGICVGMQLMASRGLEDGDTPGFGWLRGDVCAITPAPDGDRDRKIPHMGWNSLTFRQDHPVFAGCDDGMAVYFLHSFAFEGETDAILAETDYGGPVVAAIGRDNMVGLQFHPEKSQNTGQRIMTNWLSWKP